MTRLEKIDRQEQLENSIKDIVNKAEFEKRKLNELEENEFSKLTEELINIRKELKETEDFITINEQTKPTIMEKRQVDMSLIKILKETRDGNQSEETKAIIEAGKSEMRKSGVDLKSSIVLPSFNGVEERAINVGTDASGHYAVEVNKANILSPLLNELVLVKAGAKLLTGLTGDVAIPRLNDISATWEGETAKTAEANATFSQIEFRPKRLSVVVPISNTWLEQDSVGAEQAIRQLILDAVRIKIEQTALGSAAETAGKIPAGLFYNATNKGAMTFEGVVGLEGSLLEGNVNPGCYICHPKLMVKAKTTKVDAGSGKMLYEGGSMNGYPVYATNSVASGMATAKDEYGILMGDFSNFYMCFWNGLGIQTDPFTLAAENTTRLIINFYADFKPVREGAIVAVSMK